MNAMKPTKKISSSLSSRKKKEKLKVVYISSPMKVKTSASKFRALVQELTGRDSDITRYDHDHHGGYFHHGAAADPTATATGDGKPVECTTTDQEGMLSSGSGSEYSFLDDIFRSEIMVDDRRFDFDQGMFPSYSLYDSCF